MPFRGEPERVSSTDSSINAGNHFIRRNRWNQAVFSAPTSVDPWRPTSIPGEFVPIPRFTSGTSSMLFEDPPQPTQDPHFPFFPRRRNAQTRLSRTVAAIVRMKTVVIVCQSICESSGDNRLSASQLLPTGAVSPKIEHNWILKYVPGDILQGNAFRESGYRSVYASLESPESSCFLAIGTPHVWRRRICLDSGESNHRPTKSLESKIHVRCDN